jgi:hypothetical protein
MKCGCTTVNLHKHQSVEWKHIIAEDKAFCCRKDVDAVLGHYWVHP